MKLQHHAVEPSQALHELFCNNKTMALHSEAQQNQAIRDIILGQWFMLHFMQIV